MNIQPGDILLTRNAGDERSNQTPGYFNHAAVYAGDQIVIEAQMYVKDGKCSDDPQFPGAIIKSDFKEFWDRYPIIRVLRLPIGSLHVLEAELMVGLPYRRISSFFRRQRPDRRGMNCVSVVRRAVMRVTGEDPGWRIPDDINNFKDIKIVTEKV